MMNAETQLLYSSDYPHWDFDLPSTIYDLPFLSEKAKHNILGGTAARLFKLPPRNEKQKENLQEVRQSARRCCGLILPPVLSVERCFGMLMPGLAPGISFLGGGRC